MDNNLSEGEKKLLRIQGIDPDFYDGGCHKCGCQDLIFKHNIGVGKTEISVYCCRNCGSTVRGKNEG